MGSGAGSVDMKHAGRKGLAIRFNHSSIHPSIHPSIQSSSMQTGKVVVLALLLAFRRSNSNPSSTNISSPDSQNTHSTIAGHSPHMKMHSFEPRDYLSQCTVASHRMEPPLTSYDNTSVAYSRTCVTNDKETMALFAARGRPNWRDAHALFDTTMHAHKCTN